MNTFTVNYDAMNYESKRIFKIIMGILVITFVILLTLRYIKKIPPVVKVAALAFDIIVVYYIVKYVITKKS